MEASVDRRPSETAESHKLPVLAAFMSALVPGAGQLYGGRARRALVFFAPFVFLVAALIALINRGAIGVVGLVVQPRVLWALLAVNLVVWGWRTFSVVDAFRVTNGRRWPGWISSVAVALLVIGVTLPHIVVANYGLETIETLETVFLSDAAETAAAAAPPVIRVEQPPLSHLIQDPALVDGYEPIDRSPRNLMFREGVGDPQARDVLGDVLAPPSLLDAPFLPFDLRVGPTRLTILLAGGDRGPGREGMRTDSMMVLTIDTETGEAAIFGLPRNLKDVPLPSPWQHTFTAFEERVRVRDTTDLDLDGFPDHWVDVDGDEIPDEPPYEHCHCWPAMLNKVHQYTADWTGTFPESPDPGMEMLKRVISNLIDLPIDYFVLVDMAGFVRSIDALGGVEVMVTEPMHVAVSVPWEGAGRPVVNVEPGLNTLSGLEALAWVRWRRGSSDYVRMGRQRCLVRSAAAKADPFTLLRQFSEITDTVQSSVVTDIPVSFLPDLVEIAGKVDFDNVATIGLVPSYYSAGRTHGHLKYPTPHVSRMRSKVRQVVEEGAEAQSKTGASECGI